MIDSAGIIAPTRLSILRTLIMPRLLSNCDKFVILLLLLTEYSHVGLDTFCASYVPREARSRRPQIESQSVRGFFLCF